MTVAPAGQLTTPAAGIGFTARARAWLRAAFPRLPPRTRTSAAITAGAPILPAERVLTSSRDVAGSLIVATRRALYHQDRREPSQGWSRLGWENVTRVSWDDRRRILTLTGLRPDGTWRTDLRLPRHTALAELARERVASTLLASTTVRLGGRVCACVTARRQPGSGKVMWVVVLNGADGAGEPAIRARVAAAIATLRADTGIPAEDATDTGRETQATR